MADLVAWTVYGAVAVVVIAAIATWLASSWEGRITRCGVNAADELDAMTWMAAVREPAPQRRDARGRFLPRER